MSDPDVIKISFDSGIEVWLRPGDTGYILAQEIQRLTEQLSRAEEHRVHCTANTCCLEVLDE